MSWFEDRFEDVVVGDEVDVHTIDGTTYERSALLEIKDDAIVIGWGRAVVVILDHELAGVDVVPRVRPDGPETAEGGLIGQEPY